MRSGAMKRRLFGLQGVKTGGGEGGGEREREGLFHGHPVKRKRGGWGGITAGVRKRQRFRVVSQRVQEVRERVTSSAAGRANHQSLQPSTHCVFVCTDQFQSKSPSQGPRTPLVTMQLLPPSISLRVPNLNLTGVAPQRVDVPF